MAVAAHARIRGLARRKSRDERLDYPGPKLVPQVDREVRQTHRVGELASLGNRRSRAAAALGVVLRVRPQLQRDRRRLAVCAHSSAATALSTPPLIATRVRPCTACRTGAWARTAPPSARARASAASSAAWSLPGLRPPSSAEISSVPIRPASNSDRPRTSVTAALPAAAAEPQPSASKPASATTPSRRLTENRIRSQQDPPPDSDAVGVGRGSAPCPCGEVR